MRPSLVDKFVMLEDNTFAWSTIEATNGRSSEAHTLRHKHREKKGKVCREQQQQPCLESNNVCAVSILKWKKLFGEMSSGNFVSVCTGYIWKYSWQGLSMFDVAMTLFTTPFAHVTDTRLGKCVCATSRSKHFQVEGHLYSQSNTSSALHTAGHCRPLRDDHYSLQFWQYQLARFINFNKFIKSCI